MGVSTTLVVKGPVLAMSQGLLLWWRLAKRAQQVRNGGHWKGVHGLNPDLRYYELGTLLLQQLLQLRQAFSGRAAPTLSREPWALRRRLSVLTIGSVPFLMNCYDSRFRSGPQEHRCWLDCSPASWGRNS